jgi:hypothetical protein
MQEFVMELSNIWGCVSLSEGRMKERGSIGVDGGDGNEERLRSTAALMAEGSFYTCEQYFPIINFSYELLS